MDSAYRNWEAAFFRLQAERDVLSSQLVDVDAKLSEIDKQREAVRAAQAIVQQVAKHTQEALQVRLSELCSVAMRSVFDNAYELSVEFVERRGKTECDIMFVRDGVKVDPLSAAGGGAVDIASLTLRFSLWGLLSSRTAPIFVFDEPLKWLKGDELPARGARLMSYLASELGVQIIMVSHDGDLIEAADKTYRVTNSHGKSVVAVVNE